jgi:hypothetical protein
MLRLSKQDDASAHPPLDPLPLVLYCPDKKVQGQGCKQPRSRTMTWETPEFVEVKMDAEINSYQDDFGGDRDTGV